MTLSRAKRQTPSGSKKTSPRSAKRASHKLKFLTPTEVADRLLVAPVTVRLWASKGLLPSVTTLGGHRRFREEDVAAFVAEHQQTHQQVINAERGPSSSVLIIDDDEQFARYLAELIKAHAPGIVVELAHDGFSAGIKCQQLRPDIVTLDIQMPEMDGFEVCTLLRSMFGKLKPRIVALTGFPSRSNVERILAAGADCCLSKKASAAELLRELDIKQAAKQSL